MLVLVNGFFVAAEFALVRARRSRSRSWPSRASAGAAIALAQLGDLTEYLSACQFGITLASLGIGFLGEPAIAQLLEPLFGDALSHGAAVAISVAIAYLHRHGAAHHRRRAGAEDLGDRQHAETVARRIARPLQLFARVFQPVHRGCSTAPRTASCG